MDETHSTSQATPKDFFIHLGTLITLYASATALLILLFQVINYVFVDELFTYFDPYSGAVRFAIATLIILFPVFVLLSWMNSREYSLNSEKRKLWIKKWATYLTLFVGGAVILGDLITLLNYFLGGEITTRFILKVLAVLVVSGVVFGYYLYEIRRTDFSNSKITKIFLSVAVLLVVGSVVLAFVIVGGPIKQRELRSDIQKVNDLQNLQWEIINYRTAKGILPASLDDLSANLNNVPQIFDKQTGELYEYRVIDESSFELCADFNHESINQGRMSYAYPNESWNHGAGLHCFERKIDQDFLPKTPSVR